MTMEMSEVYPGETWVELKSGGKGTVMLDGDDFPMKWTLDGESITISIEEVDSVGRLTDGVITVDLMDMGVELTFLKEGAEIPPPKSLIKMRATGKSSGWRAKIPSPPFPSPRKT
ncbi:MAG: hypothetical protein PUC62_08205 [Oscillospiraceae bacterium]|nr:hypothetical protein [Oscillospiraceae bacterium]